MSFYGNRLKKKNCYNIKIVNWEGKVAKDYKRYPSTKQTHRRFGKRDLYIQVV